MDITKQYLDQAEDGIAKQRDELIAKLNHVNGALEMLAMIRAEMEKEPDKNTEKVYEATCSKCGTVFSHWHKEVGPEWVCASCE